MSGVGGSSVITLSFDVFVTIGGHSYSARLLADLNSPERILGRDVLNQLVVTFDGPAGQVIVNP